jgi:hypothetical protein
MIKKMEQVESKDIPDFQAFEEINIVDLETKKEKTVRSVAVDYQSGVDFIIWQWWDGVLSEVGNKRCFGVMLFYLFRKRYPISSFVSKM